MTGAGDEPPGERESANQIGRSGRTPTTIVRIEEPEAIATILAHFECMGAQRGQSELP